MRQLNLTLKRYKFIVVKDFFPFLKRLIFMLSFVFGLMSIEAVFPQEASADVTAAEDAPQTENAVEADADAENTAAVETSKETAPPAGNEAVSDAASADVPLNAGEASGVSGAENENSSAENTTAADPPALNLSETDKTAAAVGAAASAAAAAAAAASPKTEEAVPSSSPETEKPDVPSATPAVPPKPPNEKQLNTLRYGTETEIAALVQTLKNEKDSSLDSELIVLIEKSKNKNILSGIFSFFAEMEKPGLEERAVRVVVERDGEDPGTVQAAVNYLGRVKAVQAEEALRELIDSGENRYLNGAIRALGRAGGGGQGTELPDQTADFLLDYYENGAPNNEDQREIVVALGENGSPKAAEFLSEMIRNNDERVVLRMAALDALSKLGGEEGLDAVIEAVSASDPNVRSSAIAALGPFTGEAADKAILDGFRDSYYRTRIGAAQAAGKRKMEAAVQYLKFRADNDEVPGVKDEAIRALGAIANDEAVKILDSLLSERKNSDRVRVLAGEMLIKIDSGGWASKVIVELDDARTRNQTTLYNGFLRILGPGVSPSMESLVKRFFASGTVIEKSYAIDMVLNNEFKNMAPDLRLLLDEKKSGAGLARKAGATLEKLGLSLNGEDPSGEQTQTQGESANPP